MQCAATEQQALEFVSILLTIQRLTMAASAMEFFNTEEAFLLRSFKEVVMVWKTGTGQANFNLQVKDGKSDIQLSFRLGQPSDPHLCPPSLNNKSWKSLF